MGCSTILRDRSERHRDQRDVPSCGSIGLSPTDRWISTADANTALITHQRRRYPQFWRPGRGGRTRWAHFEFTRLKIEPIILRKKIEDLPVLRAFDCCQTISCRRLRRMRP